MLLPTKAQALSLLGTPHLHLQEWKWWCKSMREFLVCCGGHKNHRIYSCLLLLVHKGWGFIPVQNRRRHGWVGSPWSVVGSPWSVSLFTTGRHSTRWAGVYTITLSSCRLGRRAECSSSYLKSIEMVIALFWRDIKVFFCAIDSFHFGYIEFQKKIVF